MKFSTVRFELAKLTGPAPHGAGGLKCRSRGCTPFIPPSRPARGGWIEICWRRWPGNWRDSPAPHGAGGLKSDAEQAAGSPERSRPARGGWIEILYLAPYLLFQASRPARGGWIEIKNIFVDSLYQNCPAPHGAGGLKSLALAVALSSQSSRPARGGWIEISPCAWCPLCCWVPPRTGRVD